MKRICALWVIAGFASATVVAQGNGERLLILDRKARTLVSVAAASGEKLQTLVLPGEPDDLLLAPGEKRLVVLNRVQNREGPASLLVVDAQSLQTIARVDAGLGIPGGRVEYGAIGSISTVWRWGPSGTVMSPDGASLIVLSPGIADDPPKAKPGELIKINLQDGTVSGRITLDQPITGYHRLLGAAMGRERNALLSSADGRTVAVFQRKEKRHPARLHLIDTQAMSLLATVPFDDDPSDAAMSPDGKEVYVWEYDKPKAAEQRRLLVVSVGDRAVVKTLNVGDEPDSSLSAHAPMPKEGIEPWFPSDGSVLAVPPDRPPAVRVSPDGARVFLAAGGWLAIVDRARYEMTGQIRLPGELRGLGLAADGQTAFVQVLGSWGNAVLFLGVVRSGADGKWAPVPMHTMRTTMRFQNEDGSELHMGLARHDATWKLPSGAPWLPDSIPQIHFAQGIPIGPARVAVVRGYGWRGKSAHQMLVFVPTQWKIEDRAGRLAVSATTQGDRSIVTLKQKGDLDASAGYVLKQLEFGLGTLQGIEIVVLDVESQSQWPKDKKEFDAKQWFGKTGYFISLGRSRDGRRAAVVTESAVVVFDAGAWKPLYRVTELQSPVRAVFVGN